MVITYQTALLHIDVELAVPSAFLQEILHRNSVFLMKYGVSYRFARKRQCLLNVNIPFGSLQ